MKKLITTFAAAVIACSVFSHQASADPITGDIDFAGQATFNTNSLATATQVINFQPFSGGPNQSATVTSATGSFATTVANGSLASFPNIYTFNPSSAVTPLWTVGGFTFNLLTSTIVTQNSMMLIITGSGILTGPAGFDPTPGLWAFTSQQANGGTATSFSFSANTAAAGVPEGGTTVALLGIALLGVVGLHRKLARS